MATATFLPVDEYLAKTWRPDREYIDGEVRERNLGEFDHGDLQSALDTWFRTRRRKWGIKVSVEQRVQVKKTRFRVPDVCVISGDHPLEKIITHPPLVCIEILSKDDTIRSMQERIADYITMGVPNIWLFDPEERLVWVCTAEAMTKVTSGVLTVPGTDIVVPLEEIWADLDWPAQKSSE